MTALAQYLRETNQWGELFGQRPLFFPLDARAILDKIECELSPENLHMDGEADPRWVQQRLALLTKAREQVLQANPKYLEANHE